MKYKNNLILVEKKENHVGIVTLNSPPLNLNTIESMEELREAFRKIEKDPDIRAVILTGAGLKAFNVGSDLSGFKGMSGDFRGKKFYMETDMMNTIEFLPKPTICAIEGYCMGGGLEVALCCDIRIGSDESVYAFPEINLGVYPASGGIFRLPKIIGLPKAYELLYTGDSIAADEAYRLGLLNKTVPKGSTLEAAMTMAEKIAIKAPEALRVIKKGARDMWLKDSKDNYYTNLDYIDQIFDSYNGVEGVNAFLEKRKPQFKFD
jgi:enoyl-CoA hydratase/carnithine racemase